MSTHEDDLSAHSEPPEQPAQPGQPGQPGQSVHLSPFAHPDDPSPFARPADDRPLAPDTRAPGMPHGAARLLARITRHTQLRTGRVIIALVERRRGYVTSVGWTLVADIESGASHRPLGPAEKDLRVRAHQTLDRMTLPARDRRSAYAVAVVRCRTGRVVWLPADLAWIQALGELAARDGMAVLESFLVTEHGWRCFDAADGGYQPSLAA